MPLDLSPPPLTRPLLFALGTLLALAAAFGPRAALAQPVQQKLTADDGSGGDYFGYSVSVSGDVAVVGAPWDDDNGDASGSAYVFRYDGASWVEDQKLTATDGSAEAWFGWSVSVSGDIALVGAYMDDDHGTDSGSAYVFRYDGASWVQEQKLTAADGSARDWFGFSVSVSGDIAVVGAFGDDSVRGSAYVFRFDDSAWVEEQKLTLADGSAYDYFGFSVSVSGDIAVVGAIGGGDNGPSSGSAYIYRRVGSAWVQAKKLTAPDDSVYAYFGLSVSVMGDVALIGARGGDGSVPGSGSAYVFSRSTSVATEPEAAPSALIVHPPVPNPTAERAAVVFALAEAAWVRLGLYDVLGREVTVVDAGRLAAGAHRLPLDVSSLPAGVYVWRLAAGERVEAGRLTVAR